MTGAFLHQPVMLVEVVEALTPALMQFILMQPLAEAATAALCWRLPTARLLPSTATRMRLPQARVWLMLFPGD